MDTVRRVLGLCSKDTKKKLALALIAAILTAVLSVLANILFGKLAEHITKLNKNDFESVRPIIVVLVMILGAYLTNAVLSYFQERFGDYFRFSALNELRLKGYEKLQRLPIDYFANNRAGTIVQRTTYVNTVINWAADFADFRIYNVAIPLFSLLPFFIYSPYIGSITLLGVCATVMLQMKKTRVRKPYLISGNSAWDEAVGIFNEHVSHVMTSRTSAHQSSLHAIFHKALSVQLGFRKKQNQVEWKYNTLQLIFEALIISGVLAITVYQAYQGKIGIAALVAISAMIRNIMFNSRGISMLYDSYITAATEGKKYLDLIDEPESKIDTATGKKLRTIRTLELRSVSFRYSDSNASSLKDINFTLSARQKIGIVGVSGGGKSTLAKLLMRLHAPTEGSIFINGLPIEQYSIESIRDQFGVVLQDVALYHVSIADNIRIAKPKASEADIIRALKLANAWEFVNDLPEGIHTVVGERGVKLSGGQRQRIAIARAAVKAPSCIILDEATSALDSSAEKEVQRGLEKLMKNTSSVIIAHRLSTIVTCDEILVIDKGTIIERGSHDELLNKKGAYAVLWKNQNER